MRAIWLKDICLTALKIVLMTLCAIMFAGCGPLEDNRALWERTRDEMEGGNNNSVNPFNGTSWSGSYDGMSIVLSFTDSTWTMVQDGYLMNGSYTRQGTVNEVRLSRGETEINVAEATISGNTLTLTIYDSFGGRYTITFTKGSASGPFFTVPGSNLAAKLSWLESNVQSSSEYIVDVNTTESIGPRELSYGRSNVTITLRGVDSRRTVSLSSNGSMFTIGSGVTLVLDNNITLQGRSNNSDPLVMVSSSGTLFMNTGSVVTGNTIGNSNNTGYASGGGVCVSGTFIMNGGEISYNTSYGYGGGVYVSSSATFTMNGGKIHHNSTRSPGSSYANDGGGIYVIGSTLIINDGEICNNSVDITGYHRGSGSGIFAAYADITMNGGSIHTNTGDSGVTLNTQVNFVMAGGEISNNTGGYSGGGVYLAIPDSSFIMIGGEISYNTSYGYGGGVCVNGTFSKTSGTIYGYSTGNTNSNVVKESSSGAVLSNQGHAVYVYNSPDRRRETTAGPSVYLNAAVAGAAGGWEN